MLPFEPLWQLGDREYSRPVTRAVLRPALLLLFSPALTILLERACHFSCSQASRDVMHDISPRNKEGCKIDR